MSSSLAFVPREKRLVGFRNHGNTCFLNAALQVLLCSEKVVTQVQKHRAASACGRGRQGECVACAFLQDYTATLETAGAATDPAAMLCLLPRLMPGMEHGSQQDSQQFLQNLLNELNKDLGEFALQQGQEQWTTQCNECNQTKNEPLRAMWGVPVPVRETLRESLEAVFVTERMTGTEKVRCFRCQRYTSADRTGRLPAVPEILFVQLSRFQYEKHSQRSVRVRGESRIDLELDVSKHRDPEHADPTLPENRLRLLGVVMHRGRSLDGGHYLAAVPADRVNWHLFDDSRVTYESGAQFGDRLKDVYYAVYERCVQRPPKPRPPTVVPSEPVETGPAASCEETGDLMLSRLGPAPRTYSRPRAPLFARPAAVPVPAVRVPRAAAPVPGPVTGSTMRPQAQSTPLFSASRSVGGRFPDIPVAPSSSAFNETPPTSRSKITRILGSKVTSSIATANVSLSTDTTRSSSTSGSTPTRLASRLPPLGMSVSPIGGTSSPSTHSVKVVVSAAADPGGDELFSNWSPEIRFDSESLDTSLSVASLSVGTMSSLATTSLPTATTRSTPLSSPAPRLPVSPLSMRRSPSPNYSPPAVLPALAYVPHVSEVWNGGGVAPRTYTAQPQSSNANFLTSLKVRAPVDPASAALLSPGYSVPREVAARQRVRELALATTPTLARSPPRFLTPMPRIGPSPPPAWITRTYPCRTGPASAHYRPHPRPASDSSEEEDEARLPKPAALHDPPRPLYRCAHCCRCKRSKAAVELHRLRRHVFDGLPDTRPFSCCHRGCRRRLATAEALHLHLREHAKGSSVNREVRPRPSERHPHECRTCKEKFKDCRDLFRHRKAFGDRRKGTNCKSCVKRHKKWLQKNEYRLNVRPWEKIRETLLGQGQMYYV